MFSGRLTAPNDTVMLIQKSRDVTPYFITEDNTTHELSYSKICATSCELRCLSHAVMFCCTCNFYGFRHRLFWIILQLLLSLHLLRISNCLGSVAEACWRQSASASDLLWHLFFIVPISILLIPPPNALLIRWSHTMLISKSIFHTNNGFKLRILHHGLCFLLQGSYCTDWAEHTVKAAVPQLQFWCVRTCVSKPIRTGSCTTNTSIVISVVLAMLLVLQTPALLIDTAKSIRNCELPYTMACGVKHLQHQTSEHKVVTVIAKNMLHTELLWTPAGGYFFAHIAYTRKLNKIWQT